MKKQLANVIILCLLFLSFSACQGQGNKNEKLSNALEAYLYAMGNDDETAIEPDISALSSKDKAEIINQLSFAFVFEHEDYLLSYLDRQWPEWQQDQGLIVKYLLNRNDLEKRRLEPMADDRLTLQSEQSITTVEDFQQIAIKQVVEKGYPEKKLYYLTESPSYHFVYSEGQILMDRAFIILLDLSQAKAFNCNYNNGKLFINSSNMDGKLRLNSPLHTLRSFRAEEFRHLISPKLGYAELSWSLKPFAAKSIEVYFDGQYYWRPQELEKEKQTTTTKEPLLAIETETKPPRQPMFEAYLQIKNDKIVEDFLLYR